MSSLKFVNVIRSPFGKLSIPQKYKHYHTKSVALLLQCDYFITIMLSVEIIPKACSLK